MSVVLAVWVAVVAVCCEALEVAVVVVDVDVVELDPAAGAAGATAAPLLRAENENEGDDPGCPCWNPLVPKACRLLVTMAAWP